MSKHRNLIKNLDFTSYKVSIAIFFSPVIEKVYYLDIPVEEKVIIDESFEIRDLVYSKKELHKYLVLVLSSERSLLYLGNSTQFIRLASNTPEHFAACRHDAPERVANFSDPSHSKEVRLDKFLHNIDNGLRVILNASPLPLFVMATEKIAGRFKKITQYANRITSSVYRNFEGSSTADIRKAIAPIVEDLKKVKEADLLLRLEAARGAGKLAIGIQNAWREATQKGGRLLVLEKNYMCAADPGECFQKDLFLFFGQTSLTDEAARFLESKNEEKYAYPKDKENKDNVWGDFYSIPIKVSTIHGVKGETHKATLYLENKIS